VLLEGLSPRVGCHGSRGKLHIPLLLSEAELWLLTRWPLRVPGSFLRTIGCLSARAESAAPAHLAASFPLRVSNIFMSVF